MDGMKECARSGVEKMKKILEHWDLTPVLRNVGGGRMKVGGGGPLKSNTTIHWGTSLPTKIERNAGRGTPDRADQASLGV